jgi:hypothetical protein
MKHKKDLINTVALISIISLMALTGCEKKSTLNAEPVTDNSVKTQAEPTASLTEKSPTTKQREVKKPSKDEIQKAIEAYKKVLNEPLSEELKDFVLIDLDFDGIPELFGGNYAKEFNPIDFAMTVKGGSPVKLSLNGDNGISGNENNGRIDIGLVALSEIKLYKNEQTNSYVYVGKDVASRSYDVGSGAEYEISLSEGSITSKQIFFNTFDNEDNKNQSSYKYIKNQVSKSEYDTKHDEYYSNLKEDVIKIYKGNINLNSEKSINEFLVKGFLSVTGESSTLATKATATKFKGKY